MTAFLKRVSICGFEAVLPYLETKTLVLGSMPEQVAL